MLSYIGSLSYRKDFAVQAYLFHDETVSFHLSWPHTRMCVCLSPFPNNECLDRLVFHRPGVLSNRHKTIDPSVCMCVCGRSFKEDPRNSSCNGILKRPTRLQEGRQKPTLTDGWERQLVSGQVTIATLRQTKDRVLVSGGFVDLATSLTY